MLLTQMCKVTVAIQVPILLFKNGQRILRPHFHSQGMGLLPSVKQISLAETKFSVRNLYFPRQMVHVSHHLSLYFQNLQRKYAKLLLLETSTESVLRTFTKMVLKENMDSLQKSFKYYVIH